jgi:hypothetical protein
VVKWDFFHPREKFLILEITPKGTNGLFLSVDEDRNIVFEKLIEGAPLAKFLKSPARRVSEKTWEGRHFFRSRRRVIAAADSSLATTIPVPLKLSREHANMKSRITIAELENLIAQAMAKVFNGCRNEAAKRLAASDLDAVLVGAKADHFAVDGRALASPVGVAGKKISLLLEFTFATRRIFEDLKPFFNSPQEFFFAEAPQAHLRAIARVQKLPLNLIAAGDEGASLFILERPKGEYAVLYRERFPWSFSSLLGNIREAFAVNEEAAKKLYCLYHRGLVSENAKRAFQKIVEPALQAFFGEIAKGKIKGAVYSDMPHALPISLPHKHGAATLVRHPAKEILAELGFTLPAHGPKEKSRMDREDNTIPRMLLYFVEAYFDKSNSEINRKLRRRLHWLAG